MEHNNLPEELKGRTPTLRTVPMPADANVDGDIFGGWILSQMDLAAGLRANEYTRGRVVTVGIDAMSFHKPVFIGDEVGFYTEIVKVGRTSVTIKVESWSRRRANWDEHLKVTEGIFTFVAVDRERKPVEVAARRG